MDIGDVLEEIDKKLTTSSIEEQPVIIEKCLKMLLKLFFISFTPAPQLTKFHFALNLLRRF